jgi:hypothetical protein
MNKKLFKSLFTLLLFATFALLADNRGKITKKKSYKGEYKTNNSSILNVYNTYGKVEIKTWDKSEIQYEVKVIVSGNTLSEVEDLMDKIDFHRREKGNTLELMTIIKESSQGFFGALKQAFSNIGSKGLHKEINYTVYVPTYLALEIDNNYGDIVIEETKGPTSIDLDYGKLIAKGLLNRDNNISLDYSIGSQIDHIRSVNLSCDYSRVDISHAGNMRLSANYSDLTIERVSDIKYSIDYGSLVIYDVENSKGSSDYAKFHIHNLRKTAKVHASYGGVMIRLGESFDRLKLSSDYTGVRVEAPKTIAIAQKLSSSYASIKGLSKFEETKHEKDSGDLDFIGYRFTSDGCGTIDADVSYGKYNFVLY